MQRRPVRPRYGHLYAAAVLRPLGEQLVAALTPAAGDTVCDVMCDGGTLTRLLAEGCGVEGKVIAVDTDIGLAALARSEAQGMCAVDVARFHSGRIELPAAACDRVASLLTLGFGDLSATFRECQRVAREPGRVAAVVWDPLHPPAHEHALQQAFAAAGHDSIFLACVMPALPAHVTSKAAALRDVVRFDGLLHLWAAMVEDRALVLEIDKLPQALLDSVRHRLAASLSDYAGHDGAMRIPVQALLLS